MNPEGEQMIQEAQEGTLTLTPEVPPVNEFTYREMYQDIKYPPQESWGKTFKKREQAFLAVNENKKEIVMGKKTYRRYDSGWINITDTLAVDSAQ